jgi:4-amino-4-deoxy-L-arabinose transferase-like glycosyltransferase
LAVVSGLAYGWRMGSSIEIFYAAAVRSMSVSWHDFAYAAFDPAGTVSIDKLPGAFWVQALSVRLFGVHAWALALPQVIEGSLTVLVLYRAVRRLAGPGAGLIAAAVLAVSPATVTLNRGNISDTLLVLLLVLAADSVVAATAGRLRSVLMAGMWVGLAFQAKMLEAWLVVPAFALAYLIAGRANLWSRVLRQAAMVIVVIAVSLSWMLFVTLTPPAHRPYVDGSQHNSVFAQVFDYNGFGRVGQPSPNAELGRTLDIPFLATPAPSPSWSRLLTGAYGRDTGWLLPAAMAIAALGLVVRRRKPRTDPLRAGIVVWGLWLLALGVVFSTSATINAYYLAALSPAVAALLGIGAKLAWDGRQAVVTRAALVFVVVGTAGYAFWLLPGAGTGLPAWLAPAVLGTGCAAGAWVAGRAVVRRARVAVWELAAWELACIGVVVALVPLVASLSVVTNTLGAFDTPFQPTAATAFTKAFFGAPLQTPAGLGKIEAVRNGAPDLMATQTSVLAAPFIFATGQEVLPIGGYSGTTPAPSVGRLRALVAAGVFHLVLVGPTSTDPRVEWIRRHCLKAPTPSNGAAAGVAAPPGVYYCTAPH